MPAVGLLVAVPFVAGAALSVAALPPARWSAAVALVLYACAVAAWTMGRVRPCALLLPALSLTLGLALGTRASEAALEPGLRVVLDEAVGGFALRSPGPGGEHGPIVLRAVLREDAALRDDHALLRAEAVGLHVDGRWREVDGGVQLSVGGELFAERAGEWRAARTVEAPVTFRRPARYLNPGVRDFERELALGGTALFGSIKSGLLVDVHAPGSAIDEGLASARARVRRSIARWVAPVSPLSSGIVTAVLIGDRSGLPDEVRDRLQAAGTFHVIAISGGNIAILAGLAIGLLMVVGVRGRVASLAAAGVLLAYAHVVAAGPSVWRATTMAVIYLAAKGLDHRTPPWQAIAVAAALMIAIDPAEVRDPGFLLTCGATAALVECMRRLARRTPARRRVVVGWIAASVAASLAVEAVLMPASAWLFSRVTFAGVGLNLLAVPLMAGVQIAGMAVVALDVVGVDATGPAWIAHTAAASIVGSAGWLDAAPWLSWRVPPPGAWPLAVYYASLLAMAFAPRARVRLVAAVPLAVSGLVIVSGWSPRVDAPSARLRLTVLDVGQAEAMLLELPEGPRLLVDSGGVPFGDGVDIGGRVVAPALWWRGLRTLDGLLVTHGDPDHAGGAEVLTGIFRPRWLWEGIEVPSHTPTARLRRQAADVGARVERLHAGREFAFGEARVRVLHPPEPDWERPRVRNDDSVVLEVVYRDVALLLTGDVSAEVERTLVPRLTAAAHRILKVPHHGSRTSTSGLLLDAWRPQLAVISAGRGNSFGHPVPEVLERLASVGARVLRTDRHGQIVVETDGYHVDATSHLEER